VQAGEVLIQQGGDDNDLYFLLAGRCEIVVNGRKIAIRGPGEDVGEMATILPSLRRSATVQSSESGVVAKLNSIGLIEFANRYPSMWQYLAGVLAERLFQRNSLVIAAHLEIEVFVISSAEALPVARILEAAPPHLRVAIVLLTQTGGRTYSEGFSLRWDQVDFSSKLIRLGNDVKTPGSSEPVPLSEYACEVLQGWKKEQASNSPFLFPSPICPDRPISTVKTAWRATLRRAEIPHFSLYTPRHIFCTRLSEVAPDAVVQRAMRHSSPETKRRYQLGMANQVRQAVEKANESAYGKGKRTTFLLRSASVEIGGTEKRL